MAYSGRGMMRPQRFFLQRNMRVTAEKNVIL
jgi:hypothetical protein